MHTEGFGSQRHLAYDLRPVLRRERDRALQQFSALAGGYGKLETGKKDTDDHRTDVRIWFGWNRGVFD
jgi:hypothetical protein